MAGGHRAAVSDARQAVSAVWRIESARVVGALARYTGDFALAEDVAQEALAEALVTWPRDGVPRNPAGWLATVGRRRAVDAFRRHAALDERYAVLGRDLAEGGAASGGLPGLTGPAGEGLLVDPERIDDDVLALMFVACHPVLSPEARVALTLRVVGGLRSDEIARAFLVRPPRCRPGSPGQRRRCQPPRSRSRCRPRGTSAAAGLGAQRALGHLHGRVVGDVRRRPAPPRPRTRGGPLARVLACLVPDEPEAHGLLALFELTAARIPARTGPYGDPVLLDDQDRRRWDRSAIRRGRAALARAGRVGRGLGACGLQAAIAECHAVASCVDGTDWERIVVLYEALARLAPSPVVELNRAVALSMARGPAAALRVVDDLATGELASTCCRACEASC